VAKSADSALAANGVFHLSVAASVLRGGGIVAHATEAVWGLACDPFDADAVSRLIDLKGRALAKGLIVIASTEADFAIRVDYRCSPDGCRARAGPSPGAPTMRTLRWSAGFDVGQSRWSAGGARWVGGQTLLRWWNRLFASGRSWSNDRTKSNS
jgi:Telomere recombination